MPDQCQTPPAASITVLLVDDEPIVLDATKAYLTSGYGFLVDTACSGKEALACIAEKRYDAVILDYELEGMSGLELMQAIREQGYDGPIIIFTGRGREEVVIRAYDLGADGYVQKGGDIRSQFAELVHKTLTVIERRRAKDAHKKIVAEYQALYEHAPIAYFSLSPGGIITRCNKKAEILLGKGCRELTGSYFPDLFAGIPGEKERVLSLLMAACEHQEIEGEEFCILLPDGAQITVSVSVSVARDTTGTVSLIHAVLIDLTDQKARERHHAEQHRFLERLIETIPGPVFFKDKNGRYTGCNAAFESYIGLSKEKIIGTTVHDLWPAPLAVIYDAKDKELFENPGIQQYESQVAHADGSLHDVVFYKATIPDEKGEPDGIVGVILDITTRKQAERDLYDTHRLIESMIDGIPDMVGVQVPDLSIIRFNRAGYEMLGMREDEVIGRKCYELIGRSGPCEPCASRAALASKKIETAERYVPELSRYFACTATPVLDENGEVRLIIELVHDMTDQKYAENALRQANRQLRLLTEVTRHDILNNVNAMQLFLDLVKIKSDTAHIGEELDALDRLIARIQADIEFTRVYQDLGSHLPRWQRLADCVAECTIPDHIHFVIAGGEWQVYADPLLPKVFVNLVDNSLRHGGAVSRISIAAEEQEEGLLVVFEDDGVGIAPDEKELIFERGYGKNTGFGLFFIQEILGITHIRIKETGTAGQGVRFEMSVPKGMYKKDEPGQSGVGP
jgi:PAS domain S-box-containing protein